MQKLWESLILKLTEILTLYQSILELSKRKKDILVSADTQELDRIISQEQSIILQLGAFEKERQHIMDQIMTRHNVKMDKLTLSQILEFADQDSAKRLSNLGDSLKTVGAEITELNNINTQLIKQALHFVNYSINILARTVADSTYAPQGQAGNANQVRKFIDHKI